MTPTTQQADIIHAAAAGQNILCSAGAGCSKTSTISMAAPGISNSILALAFNVSIKKELETRLPPQGQAMTINGLGHRALGRMIRGVRLDADKCSNLLREFLKEDDVSFEDSQTFFGDALRLVGLAKHNGIVPRKYPYTSLLPDDDYTWLDLCDRQGIEPSDATISYARRLLVASTDLAYKGLIDFDDQIYIPTLFGAAFPKQQTILVDEAQDLSPLNHIMLSKCNPDQLIAVGDPRQAIYAFRGADSNSMASLVARFKHMDFTQLPLSMTFRCPKLVVARQKQHYPEFEAFHTNPPGQVLTWKTWDAAKIKALTGSTAILCRNNGPLLSMAFKLLRNGLPIRVHGRDIAKSLQNLLRKAVKSESVGSDAMILDIHRWFSAEAEKCLGRNARLESLHDKRESMIAIAENNRTLDECISAVDAIFSQSGKIELATGHKAKGLEWNNVIHLDPWRVPSRQSQELAALGNMTALAQERNLLYVIETRTRNNLIMAFKEAFIEE